MKRIFILILIFLTACSSTQNPASFFDLTPAPFDLSLNSTSEQIQKALWESASHWTTLQMTGSINWYLPDGMTQTVREQVWLDPLQSRFKVELTGLTNPTQSMIKISDGVTIYEVNLSSRQMLASQFPDFARVGQYIPPLEEGVAYPNPIWGQIGTPLANLAFASDFSQTKGTFKPLAVESIAGREALVADWTYIQNSAPSLKLWVDTQTGILLKMQEFGKEGGSTLQGERVVESITFDSSFDDLVFTLPAEYAQAGGQPTSQAPSNPVVTDSGLTSAEDAGELYFFLQPRAQGQSIELVKVSGVCVYDPANCPPMEKIAVPFPFNFTINALSWSPDGKYAAFSYSDQPNGTPTKLWLFEADAKTWRPLTEFPFIDPPFWSPDGAWIAFRTQDGLGSEDVQVIRPDGSGLKSVSASLPADGRPYIMDGWYTENIIMRSALPGTTGNIYLVRAENGEARPMFATLLTKAQFLASPDAGFLAYDEVDPNTSNHQVKVMEPDGANAVTVAQFTGGSIYPMVWSPDGNLIAFNYYGNMMSGNPAAEVFVVTRRGENLSSVYNGSTVGRLLFSPNGQYLLVEETTSATGGHLYLIDLATLDTNILQAPGLSTDYDWYAPSWRP